MVSSGDSKYMKELIAIIAGGLFFVGSLIVAIVAFFWLVSFPLGLAQGSMNECKRVPMISVGYNIGCYLTGNVYK